MNQRETEKAIEAEVAQWPRATVSFEAGGKHPKAKLEWGGLIKRQAFPGTPGTLTSLLKTLADMRRALKLMGATRGKETSDAEDAEVVERVYHKPNDGAEQRKLFPQAAPEPVKPKATIAEQLADHPARDLVVVPARADQDEPELEPLGEGPHDIDEDRYHSDPCPQPSLSASLAKKMIEKSPWHAWHGHPRLNPHWEPEEDLLQHRIGRAFHTLLLGKGAPIEIYPHKDWKKDVAKADKLDSLRRGCTPLLEHQHEKIEAMVRAARFQMRQREELAIAMAGGIPERVYIWIEETQWGPIYCRMMVDWTPHGGPYPVDWKTTAASAGPDGWGQRTMWDMGSDIQDAFYRRGFLKAVGLDYDALIFAVIEADQPHAMMHHRVDYEAQQEADKDVQWAINAFAACLYRKRWPGYPTDMAWQTKPGWRAQRSELRRESGQRDLAMLEQQITQLASFKDVTPQLEGVEVTADNPWGLSPLPEEGQS